MSTARTGRTLIVPSRRVLGELPERVVVFLQGVGSHAGARAALEAGGYTKADHRAGWMLLGAVCEYGETGANPADDELARAADAEIAEWVRTHFRRLQIALERLHPNVELFQGIEAPEPRESALALAKLLERVSALPAEHKPVTDTLEQRGFGR